MARKTNRKQDCEKPRLGSLSPQYNFFLNPYTDVRFTASCPGCNAKTRQRKLPLAIHFDDWGMVIMNKTCRLCPDCELLIAYQDEIEANLAQLFGQTAPEVIGNNYLVVGTVERNSWRRGLTNPLTGAEMLAALHEFQDYLNFKPARWEFVGPRDNTPKPR